MRYADSDPAFLDVVNAVRNFALPENRLPFGHVEDCLPWADRHQIFMDDPGICFGLRFFDRLG